ncbi:MAG: polyphosphate polymerase domain-containing protein [Lachnospirales bacterium]
MGNTWTESRYEKKYVINNEQYLALKEKLKDIIVEDSFGNTTICNIYYDTKDFKLIRKSLEKPVYKEKFRVRSYGLANSNSTVFAEIKKKYDGVVYKRRVPLNFNDLNDMAKTSNEELTLKDRQILNEMSWLFKLYKGLEPKMFISYDREAYFTTDESGVRVTFDSNILYRTEDLHLNTNANGENALDSNYRIMEVKTGQSVPLWLAKVFTELKIYPSSFSKYGEAYKKHSGVNNYGRIA